jgi:hypothetical protein
VSPTRVELFASVNRVIPLQVGNAGRELITDHTGTNASVASRPCNSEVAISPGRGTGSLRTFACNPSRWLARDLFMRRLRRTSALGRRFGGRLGQRDLRRLSRLPRLIGGLECSGTLSLCLSHRFLRFAHFFSS